MIDKQRLWLLVWKYEEKKYYSLERWLFLCLTAWHKLYWKWKVKTRKVKVKSNNQQWMNGEVRKVINNRYKLLLKARETLKNSKEWAEYRKARDRMYQPYLTCRSHLLEGKIFFSWLSQVILVPRQKVQRSLINTMCWPFETKRCYHNKWCWQSEFNEQLLC